jgi:TetR/AcrR family transcriptional regulator, regulator of mycofactocin system
VGRSPSTTQAELSHIALQLFAERGFDATTVDDIAAAAGIGRRTFFRYFPSKNDLPWGDFEGLIERMRTTLDAVPDDVPLTEALQGAVIEFNRFPAIEVPYHRRRMELLLTVPTLVAHSTLRYASWRAVVAEFAARRLGLPVDSMQAQGIAWTYLAVSIAAYEQWLRHDDVDLAEVLVEAFAMLATAFGNAPG